MFYDFANHLTVLRECHPMKEIVALDKQEQNRLVVLNRVEMGKMTGREAAEVL